MNINFSALGELHITIQHTLTVLQLLLPIVLLTLLLQEVMTYVELKVSKLDVLRRLPPGATGEFPLR